jgi:hypothetical protein
MKKLTPRLRMQDNYHLSVDNGNAHSKNDVRVE